MPTHSLCEQACEMASSGLAVSQISDCLGVSDTDLQAITEELTVDVEQILAGLDFDIEKILAGLDFDVEQILGSHALFGNRPA
jgi:hypothetical protein